MANYVLKIHIVFYGSYIPIHCCAKSSTYERAGDLGITLFHSHLNSVGGFSRLEDRFDHDLCFVVHVALLAFTNSVQTTFIGKHTLILLRQEGLFTSLEMSCLSSHGFVVGMCMHTSVNCNHGFIIYALAVGLSSEISMDCHGQSSVDRACGTAAIATKAAAAPAPLTDVAIGDSTHELVVVDGPLIVGAGPSGIALAACLGAKNVPYTIIDRADCTASLWKQRTYARLTLQTSNKTSHLPMMPFPADYPKYPTAQQFVAYLDAYAREFRVRPRLNHTVTDAHYLDGPAQWRVQALVPVDCKSSSSSESKVVVFLARWLVVATGENADTFVPRVPGLACFRGASMHSAEYRTGQQWRDKKVLVVGAGNSGFDIALDLDNHGAVTRLSIRSQVRTRLLEIFKFKIIYCMLRYLRFIS